MIYHHPAARDPFRPRALASVIAAALGVALPLIPSLQAQAQDSRDELAALEEITVTGSRIVRRDFEAASPILTVDEQTLERTSTVGVEAALNRLPQFVPDSTQFSSGSIEASSFDTPGIASLNLRGLGANRNLVLLDGRRAQPSNALLVVDINSIPAAAIESVEVISGGASATYGADAIGGVVNFKLKRNFEGFNLTAQTSASEQGGGEESRLSALIGGELAGGNGNVMLGLDYTKRNEVLQADRDFYVEGWRDPGTDSGDIWHARFRRDASNPPSQAAVDTLFGAGAISNLDDGYFFNAPASGQGIAEVPLFANGQAGLLGYTGPVGAATGDQLKLYQPEGEAAVLQANSTFLWASTPMDRYSIFGRADYDLNERMTVFGQANFSHIEVDTIAPYAPAVSLWNAMIPRDGRALPEELALLLDSRANPEADWSLEQYIDFAGPRGTSNETSVYQLMFGLEGELGLSDWTYEAYVSHGNTELVARHFGIISVSRYRDILAAPNWGADYSDSRDAAFELSCSSGIPVFDTFEMSQDCIDAMTMSMKHLSSIEQDIAEANFQGKLIDLPAGEARAAFGLSTRKNAFSFEPDSLLDAQSTIDRPIGLFSSNETGGETRVKELYGEALIPLLAGLPGVQDLSLELGARYSEYDTAGEIWTYKSLLDWRVNDGLRFRGGYQLANRAPNVAEMYTGTSQNVVGFSGGDPCLANTENPWGNVPGNPNREQVRQLCIEIINKSDNNPANDNLSDYALNPDLIVGPFGFVFPFERAENAGNPELNNEEAKTFTAGMVMDVGEVTAALDWYSVEITDAVEPLDAYFVYSKCLNGDGSNPEYAYNEFCRMITRYSTDGYRQTVKTPYFNIGAIETSGIDLQLNWGREALGGSLNLNFVLNYLIEYRSQQNDTAPFVESTGTLDDGGQFDYRANTTLSYLRGDWSLGLNHRYLPAIESAQAAQNPDTALQGAGSYQMFDLFGGWQVSDTVALRGGVDNFLDIDPEVVNREPGVNNALGNTIPGYYDILGRRYYLALEVQF